GEGIDIVLNSLAGEFIPKSLSLLRTGGRFLEIGKTEVWNEARVKALKPEVDYHVIYLGQTIHEQPALLRTLFEELTHAFERNELRPLPFTTFAIDNAVQAYRYMAQAKHIGKVVVVQRAEGLGQRAEGKQTQLLSALGPLPSATYLLTGGLGALGLHVAQWLVEKGARHLVLVGRKAPSANAQAAIAEMEQKGAKIVVAALDISHEDEVRRALDEIAATLPPLRGIIHSAGVLDDGVLMQQDWSRFERVLASKVLGAWHLHRLTRDLPLDFFVMFSSIASMFGAMSQGNYAAANAFMDGLAHYRRAQGLAALSINWGAWAEGGMVTELGARGASRLAQQGLSLITPENGMRMLEQLLARSCAQAAVLPIHWPKFFEQFKAGANPAFYEEMAKTLKPQERSMAIAAPVFALIKVLERALPAERLELLTAHVREQVVKVLGLEAAQAPALHQGLTDLGMDSLMAVELSNCLRASVGRTLPSTLAFEYPTIAALTKYLAEEVLQLVTTEAKNIASTNAPNGAALLQQEIEQIAESELEDSLLQELEEAGY
ncbi:MAG: SDR family NAD(P)-dependent oxidoreductase, partial [candidate division KSB1 bacterium]